MGLESPARWPGDHVMRTPQEGLHTTPPRELKGLEGGPQACRRPGMRAAAP